MKVDFMFLKVQFNFRVLQLIAGLTQPTCMEKVLGPQ